MKHEGCGGDLKKWGKKGKYRCGKCRRFVSVGRHGGFGPGYIQRQKERS